MVFIGQPFRANKNWPKDKINEQMKIKIQVVPQQPVSDNKEQANPQANNLQWVVSNKIGETNQQVWLCKTSNKMYK